MKMCVSLIYVRWEISNTIADETYFQSASQGPISVIKLMTVRMNFPGVNMGDDIVKFVKLKSRLTKKLI